MTTKKYKIGSQLFTDNNNRYYLLAYTRPGVVSIVPFGHTNFFRTRGIPISYLDEEEYLSNEEFMQLHMFSDNLKPLMIEFERLLTTSKEN